MCVVLQCCEVVGNNHTPAPIYVQQWDTVVLGAVSACYTCYMCWLYVCMVVLDRHLVVCVGYMFVCAVLVFSACSIVAICEVRFLART